MPMSNSERARLGGKGRHAGLTPEQRKEATVKARLAAAVNLVMERWSELSPEQVDKLRSAAEMSEF